MPCPHPKPVVKKAREEMKEKQQHVDRGELLWAHLAEFWGMFLDGWLPGRGGLWRTSNNLMQSIILA